MVGVVPVLGADQPGPLLCARRVQHPGLRTAFADDAVGNAGSEHNDRVVLLVCCGGELGLLDYTAMHTSP